MNKSNDKAEIIRAREILNKYRNCNYCSDVVEERVLAMAINTILPRFVMEEKLVEYIKKLDIKILLDFIANESLNKF